MISPLNSSGEVNELAAAGVASRCPSGCSRDKLVKVGYPFS